MKVFNFFEWVYEKLFVKEPGKKDFDLLLTEYKPQLGDCILMQTDGLVADGIEWFSDGEVSHTAIYVGGGERKIIESLIDGVKVKKLDKYFHGKYTIFVRRINNLKVEQAEKMKEYAYSRVNKPYDFIQFITLGFYFIMVKLGIRNKTNVIADDDKKDICSELFNDAASHAGIRLFRTKPHSVITPQDLLECERMETIVEV